MGKKALYLLCLILSSICCFSCSNKTIKSLVALDESFSMKIGEELFLTDCFKIEGFSELKVVEKRCSYTSSDESVAKVVGKKLVGVDSGITEITVRSEINTKKSCKFKVEVKKAFIDRNNSYIKDDIFENEWDYENDEPGWFRTVSMYSSNYYHVKDVNSTIWYVQTTIKVHEFGDISQADASYLPNRWPKIGIITRDSANPTDMVAFFMSATIGINDTYDANGKVIYGQDNNLWNEFGVCEVKNSRWAWEGGIGNNIARHHDYCWKSGEFITFDTEFTLGVARDGLDFHVYINDSYAGSFRLNPELEILSTNSGKAKASVVAFYGFNTDATFSDYYQTTDVEEIYQKYIPSSPRYTDVLPD